MNSDSSELSDNDAISILEYLRSKVREFGFGEIDADIGASIIEMGLDSGKEALKRYFADLFLYLKVFDAASIERTQAILDEHLKDKWNWRLLPGGDPELRRDSDYAYANGIQDMAVYRSIGALASSLADVMRGIGIEVPGDDGGDSPQFPPRERM